MGRFFGKVMMLAFVTAGLACTAPAQSNDAAAAGMHAANSESNAQAQDKHLTMEQEIAMLKARLEVLEKQVKADHAAVEDSANDAAALKQAEKQMLGASAATAHNAAPAISPQSAAQETVPQSLPNAPGKSDPHAPHSPTGTGRGSMAIRAIRIRPGIRSFSLQRSAPTLLTTMTSTGPKTTR